MLQPDRRARAEIFVDREPVCTLYRSELLRSATEPRILNITGVGGIGKSRLLAELRKEEYTGVGVRTAVVDFEAPGLRQRDPVLLHLGEQFHRQDVRFDRFDIAYAVLWQRMHPHLRMNERDLPLARESEILSQMLADVAQLPMIAGAVGLLRLADRLRLDVRRRLRIRNDERLQKLDELSEPGRLGDLARTVGELFVDELCEAAHERPFVIFTDCYEALVPEPVRTGRVAASDEWLRELLGPMAHGLVVVAGREPLGWNRHKDVWGWTERTSDHRLPGLPRWARSEFLSAAGIGDDQGRSAIVEESDGLPFYLQLAADMGGTGEGGRTPAVVPTDAILNRFLHHVGPGAEAVLPLLGVTRVFDLQIFRTLTQHFYLPSHRLAWDNLRAYSFAICRSTSLTSESSRRSWTASDTPVSTRRRPSRAAGGGRLPDASRRSWQRRGPISATSRCRSRGSRRSCAPGPTRRPSRAQRRPLPRSVDPPRSPSPQGQRHPLLGVAEGLEADLRVDTVGVVRRQEDAAQAVGGEVVADGGDEGGAEAVAAGGGGDVDVAEPGEGGEVGDDAGVGGLFAGAGGVRAEVERAGYRRLLRGQGAAERPVRVGGQPVVDAGHVEPGGVGGDLVHARKRRSAEGFTPDLFTGPSFAAGRDSQA